MSKTYNVCLFIFTDLLLLQLQINVINPQDALLMSSWQTRTAMPVHLIPTARLPVHQKNSASPPVIPASTTPVRVVRWRHMTWTATLLTLYLDSQLLVIYNLCPTSLQGFSRTPITIFPISNIHILFPNSHHHQIGWRHCGQAVQTVVSSTVLSPAFLLQQSPPTSQVPSASLTHTIYSPRFLQPHKAISQKDSGAPSKDLSSSPTSWHQAFRTRTVVSACL